MDRAYTKCTMGSEDEGRKAQKMIVKNEKRRREQRARKRKPADKQTAEDRGTLIFL